MHPSSRTASASLRKVTPWLLAFLPFLLAPLSAPARDVRFPATGIPAYSFILPDDWVSKADDAGNLIMFNPKRSACVVILVEKSTENLDTVVEDAFTVAKATATGRVEPADISGCKGRTYYATILNPKGVKLDLEMTVVRVNETYIASASVILLPGSAPADETTARLVRNGLKLVRE
jgi:hypothetical protein